MMSEENQPPYPFPLVIIPRYIPYMGKFWLGKILVSHVIKAIGKEKFGE